MLNPKTIAIIGASNHKEKVGYSLMENLKYFKGEIFPVNLHEEYIMERRCYKNVKDIKGEIDLAIIAIPAKKVIDVVKDCGKKKIKNVIVISAGFSEAGNNRLEEKLIKTAKRYNINILGPNCFGVVNPYLNLDTTFAKTSPKEGSIAFISQSGALWSAVADYSLREGFGFSGFVSLGNMADLNFSDFIEYFNKDEKTKAIVLYIELLKDGKKFMEVCKKSKKPIIAIKAGKSKAGKEATLSHTGSLAGEFEIYKAAFKQCGVELADGLVNAFDLARWKIKGKKVVIVTNAGGPAALMADYCEEKKLEVVKLPKMDFNFLWSKNNPIDLIGDALANKYRIVFDKLKGMDFYDVVIVMLTPQKMTEVMETAEAVIEFNKSKKVIACFMGDGTIEKARKKLEENNIPCFFDPKRAVGILKE